MVVVIKRSGYAVPFDSNKIEVAIRKAMRAIGEENDDLANKLTADVVKRVIQYKSEENTDEISVEKVQDFVEDALIASSHAKLAKAYISYRIKRSEARDIKDVLNVEDDLKFGTNALILLNERYLKTFDGKKETPSMMFKRVAQAVASAEKKYGENPTKWAKIFYNLMSNRVMLPNTPCLSNANTRLNYMFACYVLDIQDSMESIFKAVHDSGLVMKTGGGVGFNFSKLRPEGDVVGTTNGISSGPISFMRLFDVAADVIKQGSIRRGGCMGLFKCNHPDILKFLKCKEKEGDLANFNISVALTEEFFDCVKNGKQLPIVNPRNNEVVSYIDANHLLTLIAQHAWENGEPGLVFLDNVNRDNKLRNVLGDIETVNLCGELPQYPNECCALASINLTKFVNDNKIVWSSLRRVVRHAIRFLDDVIDSSDYVLPEIEEMEKKTRRIGLGVMGFADLLFMLEIPYDSDEALKLAEKIMSTIQDESHKTSRLLAQERGSFPLCSVSTFKEPMRNVATNSCAPTGSISIIAGCSSGIEPVFALVYRKEHVLGNRSFDEINPIFETIAKKEGWYSANLINDIIDNDGRATGLSQVPEKWQRVFRTALEISPEWHIKMQSAWQKYVDNSISKTCNLPYESTIDDVRNIIIKAHDLGCKGLTVYRNASRQKQILNIKSSKNNVCPICGSALVRGEGCVTCTNCVYSKCDI